MSRQARVLVFAVTVTIGTACGDAAPDLDRFDSGTDLPPLTLDLSTDVDTDPTSCSVIASSLSVDDDWHGTGIEVTELVPDGWAHGEHPTLLFGHGNDLFPESYSCYQHLLAQRCIRTLMPRLWNTGDGDLPHLGWETRQLRWEHTLEIYDELTATQDQELVFLGGHSMGAYTALLAAGANSAIGEDQAGNCETEQDEDELDCEPLEAAGYVVLSGWPAQRATADPPFWFDRTAFSDLEPNRFVAYGELDTSSGDQCLDQIPPSCRADSYWIESSDSGELNLRHEMVPEFEHLDFTCDVDWEQNHVAPDAIAQLVTDLGQWIWDTIEADYE